MVSKKGLLLACTGSASMGVLKMWFAGNTAQPPSVGEVPFGAVPPACPAPAVLLFAPAELEPPLAPLLLPAVLSAPAPPAGPAPEPLLLPHARAANENNNSPAPRPIAVQRISRKCHGPFVLPIPPCAMPRSLPVDHARNIGTE
jgi:hypothetical protein